jgi:hypothetical protein
MECSVGLALRFAITGTDRQADSQVLSRPAHEAPAGWGAAVQLAAFPGRTGVSRAR